MNYLYFIIKKFFSYQINIYRSNLYILYIWNVWNKNHIKKFYQDFTIVLIIKKLAKTFISSSIISRKSIWHLFLKIKKAYICVCELNYITYDKSFEIFYKGFNKILSSIFGCKVKCTFNIYLRKYLMFLKKTASISIIKWRRIKYFNQITFKAILALIMRLKLVSHLNHNISMSSIKLIKQ